jgi:hypothetical protein
MYRENRGRGGFDRGPRADLYIVGIATRNTNQKDFSKKMKS